MRTQGSQHKKSMCFTWEIVKLTDRQIDIDEKQQQGEIIGEK